MCVCVYVCVCVWLQDDWTAVVDDGYNARLQSGSCCVCVALSQRAHTHRVDDEPVSLCVCVCVCMLVVRGMEVLAWFVVIHTTGLISQAPHTQMQQ